MQQHPEDCGDVDRLDGVAFIKTLHCPLKKTDLLPELCLQLFICPRVSAICRHTSYSGVYDRELTGSPTPCGSSSTSTVT